MIKEEQRQGYMYFPSRLDADVKIPEGVRQGQFLTHPHTLKHLRKVYWKPELFCRQSYDQWVQQGRTTLLDRARTKLQGILKNHEPLPIAPKKQRTIEEIVRQLG